MIRHLVSASLLCLALVARASNSAADGVSPRVISLPSGPGSVDGLGGNFEPGPSSGGASYNVAIHMPPAVAGLVPGLSLDHAGGAGASEIGIGWKLSLPAIRRRTEDGIPRYDATDTFSLSGIGGDGELVPLGSDSYRMRFEGAFVRVRRRGDVWEVRERSGLTHYFGEAVESMDGADGRAARWNMTRTVDLHGHEIRYVYVRDNARSYLTEIHYGGSGAAEVLVALAYEGRPDVLTSYQTGQAIALGRRLHSITISRGGQPVATYTLQYATDPGLSRLASVSMVGSDGVTSLPAVRWEYGSPQYSSASVVSVSSAPGRGLLDANNDLADIDGDGAADLLVTSAGRYTVYRNDAGHSFAAPYDMATAPSLALSQAGVQLADMDGDAAVDLVAKIGIASDGFRFYPGGDRTAFGAPQLFSANPAFTFEDPDVRLLDLDFDRRTDVMITTVSGAYVAYNTGGTFTALAPIPTIDAAQVLRFSDPNVRLADLNGDRLQDIVYVRPGGVTFWPAKGRGLFDPPVVMRNVPMVPVMNELNVADINGDGLADLVRVGVTLVDIWLNQADGAFAAAPITINGTPEHRASTAVRFADMNGNGTTDIVWVDVTGDPATAWRYLDIIGDAAPGQLSRIDNGLGHITTISYRGSAQFASDDARAGHAWTTRLPSAMAVVAEVRQDDSLGSVEVTRFSYHNGLFSGARREFRGFGSATRTDVGDTDQPTLVTTFEFDLGQTDEARKGQTLQVTRADDHGGIFDRVDNTYDVVTLDAGTNGVNVVWSRQRRMERWIFERTTTPKETRTETDYDGFGNVTATREWGLVDGDNGLVGHDERFTTASYAVNEPDWILDRLATQEITDATGTRFAAKRVHYDGDPFAGLPIGQVTRGDPAREEAWAGPGESDWVAAATFQRNADGNPTEVRDGDGRRRIYTWEATTRAFPDSESIPQSGGQELTWRAQYDLRWGTTTNIVNPDSSSRAASYDALGRPSNIIEPGDTPQSPTEHYEYHLGSPLSQVEIRSRIASGAEATEIEIRFVDGLGRRRGSAVPFEGGGWVLHGVPRFGPRGWNSRIARPFVRPDHAVAALQADVPGTQTQYDCTGRVIGQLLPDGARTRVEREPQIERSFDADDTDPASPHFDTPHTRELDGLGRTTAERTASSDGDAVWRFVYAPTGSLLQRTDPIGTTSSYVVDGLARRIAQMDPDSGHRLFQFDAAGHLTARTNALGQTLQWHYDQAGRPLEHDSDGDGVFDTFWHYDTGCSHGAGFLCRLDEPRLSTALQYDARGRIVETSWTIAGSTWSAANEYDARGRVTRHTYPDGSQIDFRYNTRGLLTSAGNVIETTTYDPDRTVSSRRFGNGVVETQTPDARGRVVGLTYADATGPLESLTRSLSGADLVLGVMDDRPARTAADDRTESFGYDDLRHLTSASGTYGRIDWRYDASSRLMYRASGVSALQLGMPVYPPDPGSDHPHAPRLAGSATLTYDADGNVSSINGAVIRWDASDHPADLPTSTGDRIQSWWGVSGERRIERTIGANGSVDTRLFLSSLEELHNGRLLRYVRGGDQTVFLSNSSTGAGHGAGCRVDNVGDVGAANLAVVLVLLVLASRRRLSVYLIVLSVALGECAPSAAQLRVSDGEVVLRDFAGTSIGAVDGEGHLSQRETRFPGGMTRGPGAPMLFRSFAGSQPQGTDDFAYIGARVLMVRTGQWLSPAADSQAGGQESPYTYCDGDFASQSDPDGHQGRTLTIPVTITVIGSHPDISASFIQSALHDAQRGQFLRRVNVRLDVHYAGTPANVPDSLRSGSLTVHRVNGDSVETPNAHETAGLNTLRHGIRGIQILVVGSFHEPGGADARVSGFAWQGHHGRGSQIVIRADRLENRLGWAGGTNTIATMSRIIQHEMGHIFGLPHTERNLRINIMNPRISGSQFDDHQVNVAREGAATLARAASRASPQ